MINNIYFHNVALISNAVTNIIYAVPCYIATFNKITKTFKITKIVINYSNNINCY